MSDLDWIDIDDEWWFDDWRTAPGSVRAPVYFDALGAHCPCPEPIGRRAMDDAAPLAATRHYLGGLTA